MGSYKHIETCIGEYFAKNYAHAVEVGIGRNRTAADILRNAGTLIRAVDVRDFAPEGIPFAVDDIFEPDLTLYSGADLIYAIRPAIEMMPPLIALARRAGADLVVYHLGFEIYGNGGETIDCGVLLHRYVRRSEPVKER